MSTDVLAQLCPSEAPCDLCHGVYPIDQLVDATELFPLARRVCDDCEHELVAEHHDDPSCLCSSCDRARAKADRIYREYSARMNGGLLPVTNQLFGPGWLDEGAVPMSTPKIEATSEDHAVFAALEHIEVALIGLRNGPLTRERAAKALKAICDQVEQGCLAYAEVERRDGRAILSGAAE